MIPQPFCVCVRDRGLLVDLETHLNTDFIADTMTPEMITKHIELVQLGVLPKATLYETARKVDFLNGSIKTIGPFNECFSINEAKSYIKSDRGTA